MSENKKKLLIITGVAGMVGSTLLPKMLSKKNSIVVGIDNFRLGKHKFIKKFLNKKNFFFLKADLDKKINKLGYQFKLNSLKTIKETINNISKKTLF